MKRREFITLIGGVAATWPLAARAQQPTVPVVGFMHVGALKGNEHLWAAFQKGIGETGYIDGQNVTIEYHWAEGHDDRLPELAAGLVRRRDYACCCYSKRSYCQPKEMISANQCRYPCVWV